MSFAMLYTGEEPFLRQSPLLPRSFSFMALDIWLLDGTFDEKKTSQALQHTGVPTLVDSLECTRL